MKYVIVIVMLALLLAISVNAQWNNQYESNNTLSFMQITNITPFTDTFEHYNYNVIFPLDINTTDLWSSSTIDVTRNNNGALNGYVYRHATNHSIVYNSTGGYYGGAYQFYGGEYDALRWTAGQWEETVCNNGCSISAWIYPLDIGTRDNILSRYDETTNDRFWRFYLGTDSDLHFDLSTNGSASTSVCGADSGTNIVANTWTHVVGWFNITHCAVYIDNIRYGLEASIGTINETAWRQNEWACVGAEDTCRYFTFNGTIDEVRVWNSSISPVCVQNVYQNRYTPAECNENLIISMPMDSPSVNITHSLDTNPIVSGHQDNNRTQSIYFDGTNNYINTSDLDLFNDETVFTVSGWAITSDLKSKQGIFTKYQDSNNRITLTDWSDGKFYVHVRKAGSGFGSFDYSGVVTNGTWFHWAVIYNGSGTADSDKLKLYINGVERTLTYSAGVSTVSPDLTGYDLIIGYHGSTDYYWNGSIDDVYIWDTTLSTAEIQNLYTGTSMPDRYIYSSQLGNSYRRWNITTRNTNAYSYLTQSGNGYGFNSTWYALTDNDGVSINSWPYNITGYTNYEVIFKHKYTIDYGVETSQFTVANDSTRLYTRVGGNRYYIGGSYIAGPALAINQVGTYRFVKNGTWCQWFESLNNGHTWTLRNNATCVNTISIRLSSRDTIAMFDNILIRELVNPYPTSNPQGTYYMSYIYDSSNSTTQASTVITPYMNTLTQTPYTYNTPRDWLPYAMQLTHGLWNFTVAVNNTISNNAINTTSNIAIGFGEWHNKTVNVTNLVGTLVSSVCNYNSIQYVGSVFEVTTFNVTNLGFNCIPTSVYTASALTITNNPVNQTVLRSKFPLLLTFDKVTNITISSEESTVMYMETDVINLSQSDLPDGTITITFGDGSSQKYQYINNYLVQIEQNLSIMDTPDTDFYVSVESESGQGISDAYIYLFEYNQSSTTTTNVTFDRVGQYLSSNREPTHFIVDSNKMYSIFIERSGYSSVYLTGIVPTNVTASILNPYTFELLKSSITQSSPWTIWTYPHVIINHTNNVDIPLRMTLPTYAAIETTNQVFYLTQYRVANAVANGLGTIEVNNNINYWRPMANSYIGASQSRAYNVNMTEGVDFHWNDTQIDLTIIAFYNDIWQNYTYTIPMIRLNNIQIQIEAGTGWSGKIIAIACFIALMVIVACIKFIAQSQDMAFHTFMIGMLFIPLFASTYYALSVIIVIYYGLLWVKNITGEAA